MGMVMLPWHAYPYTFSWCRIVQADADARPLVDADAPVRCLEQSWRDPALWASSPWIGDWCLPQC